MARSSSPAGGDSYYTVIRGKKYDRRMLELAEGLTSGRGDGRISINDAKNLLRVVKDANNYSLTEKQTMEYIRRHFKFTKEGDAFFRSEIRKWAAGKGKKKTPAKAKKSAAAEPAAHSAASEVAAVAAAAAAPVEAKHDESHAHGKGAGSAWKQILIGLILILGIAAIFYFVAYKSSCARPAPTPPPVTTAPVTPAPAATPEAPKAVLVPAAPTTPVAEKKPSTSPAPVDADLQSYVSKVRLAFIAEKTALSPASEKSLDELAARLKNSGGRLQVTGHTCSLGPKAINQPISEKRAAVVKEALVARGVPADRIETQGVADTQPVGNNKTVEGRVANRRVTFKLIQ